MTTDEYIGILTRMDIDTTAPHFSRALAALDAATTRQLDDAGVDRPLREIIRIRASQINGCSYCVNEHTRDALSAGEPAARVAAVAVWRESPFFTARERAALTLTDAMTRVAAARVSDADWAAAATAFTPAELGALVALITTINAWNVVGATTHAWTAAL